MRVVVTGAGGFVGAPLVARLTADGHQVTPIVRARKGLEREVSLSELPTQALRQAVFAGVDVVVHLAGRAHVMRDGADALALYREANVAETTRFAELAAAAGVKRFIFMSTIKVNGEATRPGRPFRPDDAPDPTGPYAVSKLEAEEALRSIGLESGMEVVIIRPPLVYGPGARGNFATMIGWLRKGLPLPFGAATENLRSFVGIDNLIDLIVRCLTAEAAANRILLVADGQDVSTRSLLESLAGAMGRRARLVPVPLSWLLRAGRAARRAGAIERLIGNLQVSVEETRALLDWTPPIPLAEGLRGAVRANPARAVETL